MNDPEKRNFMISLVMRHLKAAVQAVQADSAALISAVRISAIFSVIFSETFSAAEEEAAAPVTAR